MSKKILLDKADFPDGWSLPPWVTRGWTEVPTWLIKWVKNPCNALYCGAKEELFLLYLLFSEAYPGTWIEKAPIFDLSPYKGFEDHRENYKKWGTFLPIDVGVLFITDVDPPYQHHLTDALENLIRSRKGSNKLTVVHTNLDFQKWRQKVKKNDQPLEDPLKIGLPLVITHGR